jgi:hypothetical protein
MGRCHNHHKSLWRLIFVLMFAELGAAEANDSGSARAEWRAPSRHSLSRVIVVLVGGAV